MSDEIEIDPLHQRAGPDAYVVADAIIKLAREVRGLRKDLAKYLNDEDEGVAPILTRIADVAGSISADLDEINAREKERR